MLQKKDLKKFNKKLKVLINKINVNIKFKTIHYIIIIYIYLFFI